MNCRKTAEHIVNMVKKIILGDKEYDVSNASKENSELLNKLIVLLDFSTERIQELSNTQALLQRAKVSYVKSLKTEMLSNKAGFLFGDD